MISTVTTTTTTISTSEVFPWVIIILLASFLYHYFKTKEYKGTIIGSIIIGAIFGFIYGIIVSYISASSQLEAGVPYGLMIIASLILIIAYCLASIILAFVGGLIAVKLKGKNSKVE